jgi:hypothetical protein
MSRLFSPLPFATLTLQQETHALYGDDAWDTPKREIRVHLPPDKTSDDVLEATTQVLRNNDFCRYRTSRRLGHPVEQQSPRS